MNIVSYSLHDGRRFPSLTLVDHFSRVSSAIEVGNSIPGKRVVPVLEQLARMHGLFKVITTDNGAGIISRAVYEWAHRNGVKPDFIRRGKPIEIACIESINGRLLQKCLKQSSFSSLKDAEIRIEGWRTYYTEQRLHTSLVNQTPEQFDSLGVGHAH